MSIVGLLRKNHWCSRLYLYSSEVLSVWKGRGWRVTVGRARLLIIGTSRLFDGIICGIWGLSLLSLLPYVRILRFWGCRSLFACLWSCVRLVSAVGPWRRRKEIMIVYELKQHLVRYIASRKERWYGLPLHWLLQNLSTTKVAAVAWNNFPTAPPQHDYGKWSCKVLQSLRFWYPHQSPTPTLASS